MEKISHIRPIEENGMLRAGPFNFDEYNPGCVGINIDLDGISIEYNVKNFDYRIWRTIDPENNMNLEVSEIRTTEIMDGLEDFIIVDHGKDSFQREFRMNGYENITEFLGPNKFYPIKRLC